MRLHPSLLALLAFGPLSPDALGRLSSSIPAYIDSAVHDPSRPSSDVQRDAQQKPAEILAFAGVRPGDRIADFWPAPPYSTRLLSLVAGPRGHVYAILPEKLARESPQAATEIRGELAPYANTTLLVEPFDQLAVPESLDLVYIGKVYHDFPNRQEMGPIDRAALNRAVFRALKPGGTYLVIDHAATPGSGYLDVEPDMAKRLHRIDPDVVKREVEAAGFTLAEVSPLLANPKDPRTKSVFDASIREHSDRFVFKFRKPAG